jgi:hypothetical protein
MIKAKDLVPCGTPLHESGGEILSPSQVNPFGTVPSALNAVLVK